VWGIKHLDLPVYPIFHPLFLALILCLHHSGLTDDFNIQKEKMVVNSFFYFFLKIILDNLSLLLYFTNMGKRGPKPEVNVRRAIRILRDDNYTFEEIGRVFGFSRQRAHQLYKESSDENLHQEIESKGQV